MESLLTREAVLKFLKEFEQIPDEHRLHLLVDVLLQLPNNKNDYMLLRKKGKKLKRNIENICNGSETIRTKHSRVLSSLLAHCSSLEVLQGFDLAVFMEPFCELLSRQELAYFEVMLTIIVNWCQHWFDHTPSPPHTLLSMIDIMLLKIDRDLYQHMAKLGVRAQDYAWEWMTKAFKNVVDPQEWLILWDHILANQPSFMYFIPLAGCILLGKHLTNASSRGEILEILHGSNPFDAQSLLKVAYSWEEKIPTCCHPNRILNAFNPLIIGTYPAVNPMELITLGSDEVEISDLNELLSIQIVTIISSCTTYFNLSLEKVALTHLKIDKVLKEGMDWRRKIMDF